VRRIESANALPSLDGQLLTPLATSILGLTPDQRGTRGHLVARGVLLLAYPALGSFLVNPQRAGSGARRSSLVPRFVDQPITISLWVALRSQLV
jgi:hypothetical protein